MHSSHILSESSELYSVDEHSPPVEPLLTNPPLLVRVVNVQPITAQTDEQAIAAWLAQCRSPVTAENYRKDAERFLIWLRKQDRSLREIDVEDLTAYSGFISSLSELPANQAEQWISAQRWPKSDRRWRPFQGELSISSQRQALVSIRALIRWLEKMGYREGTLGREFVITGNRERVRAKYLPWEAVSFLLDATDRMPGRTSAQARNRARVRFLVCFFVFTGAKISDLPLASMSSIFSDSNGRWWWSVPENEGKDVKIPVPLTLLNELKRYRLAMGMQELPHTTENVPLIQSLREPGAADEGSIYFSLKRLFKLASDLVRDKNPNLARQLEIASPSWLRNTALARMADMNIDPRWIQATARHVEINTTIRNLRLDTRVSYRA